jgi:hypothetical protein
MAESLLPLVVLTLWFVLFRWVLPWIGVPTCMSGSCGVSPHLAEDGARETGDPTDSSEQLIPHLRRR